MRRSVRQKTHAVHAPADSRSESPSTSEGTVALVTPSVSPTPDALVRQYPTPGNREDGTPKRPMNAFILFSNEKRGELADLNPTLSNAAVSVLLGQRWREMHANEKASYVAAARRIKEDFHREHPDAKTRCTSRKGKRKQHTSDPGSRVARNVAPASLHALAIVGSRLNQSPFDVPAATPAYSSSAYARPPLGRPPYPEDEEEEDDDEAYAEEDDDAGTLAESSCASTAGSAAGNGLSLLEQLCTIAENEHTAAAHMLSSFAAC